MMADPPGVTLEKMPSGRAAAKRRNLRSEAVTKAEAIRDWTSNFALVKAPRRNWSSRGWISPERDAAIRKRAHLRYRRANC